MVHPEEVKRRVERFPALCRASGLRVTPQRVAVYATLAATDTHPTPETIYSAVRRTLPNVSLATVYKVLDRLASHGLLVKVASADQAARYDARIDAHQHTACARCGSLSDLDLPDLAAAMSALPQPGGFQVRRVDLVLHGLCSDCAAEANAS